MEYNRIKDLADTIRYRSKLMAYYGFDVQSGKGITQSSLLLELIHKWREYDLIYKGTMTQYKNITDIQNTWQPRMALIFIVK